MPNPTAQVTAADISRLAGVTRATVSNWRRRHTDFPSPVGGTDTSPAYDLAEVRTWLAARDQLPASSPAEDLRTAVSTAPGRDAGPRLLPLVPAVAHLAPDALAALIGLPDEQLLSRARDEARPYVPLIPGATDSPFVPEDAPLLRALLHCVREQGLKETIDALDQGSDDSGTYRTPPELADLMAGLLTAPDGSYPSSVLDPACGTGGLLVAAARRGARMLYGQDVVPGLAALAAVRLGSQTPHVDFGVGTGDSLRMDQYQDMTTDAVLCNPPFGNRGWGHDDLAYDPRWVYGLPPKGEPELAWVQHCLAHLADDALAVLLMPPATAERSSGRRVRAEIVRRGALRAVIALPSGIAPPWHVGLHLWVLRRPRPDARPPQDVLFVDTDGPAPAAARRTEPHRTSRPAPDWTTLAETVLTTWRTYSTGPDAVETTSTAARVVNVTDLLDESVDLAPARHVRAAPSNEHPGRQAANAQTLLDRLGDVSATITALTRVGPWPSTGSAPRAWRTAAVADLLRGGALELIRGSADDDTKVNVQSGDILVPEVLRTSTPAARVAGLDDIGAPPAPRTAILRPDPHRLDAWFVAGFLATEPNLHAASTGSTVIRLDLRRLRIPLLPLPEQQRYGQAFQHLHTLRATVALADRLAAQATHALGTGLTSGALQPAAPDIPAPSPR